MAKDFTKVYDENARLKAENERLKEDYRQASESIGNITSNEECQHCVEKTAFPSLTCCECIFDSMCELEIVMDDKVIEQALKGE